MKKISDYYSDKIRTHGISHKGVDWNSENSQLIRFEQLSKLISSSGNILDYGCGYAAYARYLKNRNMDNYYTGFDISEEMVKHAEKFLNDYNLQGEILSSLSKSEFHYIISSGTFSVKLDIEEDLWVKHIQSELCKFNDLTIKGFSFNMLTSYSDKHMMRKDLYYADPLYWFDYCKRNFSRNIALLHDYTLFEFTLIVRK